MEYSETYGDEKRMQIIFLPELGKINALGLETQMLKP